MIKQGKGRGDVGVGRGGYYNSHKKDKYQKRDDHNNNNGVNASNINNNQNQSVAPVAVILEQLPLSVVMKQQESIRIPKINERIAQGNSMEIVELDSEKQIEVCNSCGAPRQFPNCCKMLCTDYLNHYLMPDKEKFVGCSAHDKCHFAHRADFFCRVIRVNISERLSKTGVIVGFKFDSSNKLVFEVEFKRKLKFAQNVKHIYNRNFVGSTVPIIPVPEENNIINNTKVAAPVVVIEEKRGRSPSREPNTTPPQIGTLTPTTTPASEIETKNQQQKEKSRSRSRSRSISPSISHKRKRSNSTSKSPEPKSNVEDGEYGEEDEEKRGRSKSPSTKKQKGYNEERRKSVSPETTRIVFDRSNRFIYLIYPEYISEYLMREEDYDKLLSVNKNFFD